MDRDIYILTTKSGTFPSRLIHLMTAASYTHVSIGLDGLWGEFYSFGRKYTRLMLPAGLIKESVTCGSAMTVRYQLYRLSVSENAYRRIQARLGEMYSHRERYHYSILGTLSVLFNYPLKRRSHYFCSQFVAEMLEECGALEFDKNVALVRPMDFCDIENLSLVSEGAISTLGSGQALPAPSDVVAILPFGRAIIRAYRFCQRVR